MRYHIKCHTFWLVFSWCLSLWPAPIWLGPILNSANTFSCLASHTCRRLNTFYTICVTLGMSLLHTLVAPEIPMNSGAGLTQIGFGDTDTRRSHTGYIRMIVADLSSFQKSLSRQCLLVCLRSWIRRRLPYRARGSLFSWTPQRFGHQQQNAIEIYKDNLTYVVVGKNLVRRKFSRHIDIHRYFVHELI